MEMLNVTDGYGQNFGYTLYRADISSGSNQLEFANRPRDRAQVLKRIMASCCRLADEIGSFLS